MSTPNVWYILIANGVPIAQSRRAGAIAAEASRARYAGCFVAMRAQALPIEGLEVLA